MESQTALFLSFVMVFKMKKQKEKIYLILIAVLTVFLFFFDSLLPKNFDDSFNSVSGKVLEITFDNSNEINDKSENAYKFQEFRLLITSGKHKGEEYNMRNSLETFDVYNIILEEGDKILVSLEEDDAGNITNLHIYDRKRDTKLITLMALFVFGVLLIGGKQGVKAILTLMFTVLIIIKILLPLILKGFNPLLTAICVLICIICVTLTVISGFTKKTLSAILGTSCGVIIAGIISIIAGKSTAITGLANDSAQQLVYLMNYPDIDFQGILFAGIIIGAMGAVMDVSMSIASSMHEICTIHPEITAKELVKSGMNIGRDIMGSMANTLILAYTGSSCELMLLFMAAGTKLTEIFNLDLVAAEVIRAACGSISLTFTIPFTVVISALIYKKIGAKKLKEETKSEIE